MNCGLQQNKSKPLGLKKNRVVPVVRRTGVVRSACFRTSLVPNKGEKGRNTLVYASGDVSPLPVNWKATGVPILERLKAIDTIAEANVHALQLIFLILIGTFVSYNVFRELSKRVRGEMNNYDHCCCRRVILLGCYPCTGLVVGTASGGGGKARIFFDFFASWNNMHAST